MSKRFGGKFLSAPSPLVTTSNASGIWSHHQVFRYTGANVWPSDFISKSVPGLAGKFFNGDWRATISTGNIGTLPLTTTNDSSNVTATTGLPSANHGYGVRIDHEEGTGGDNLTFSWSGPGIAETTDLSTYFRTPSVGGVLVGNYTIPSA